MTTFNEITKVPFLRVGGGGGGGPFLVLRAGSRPVGWWSRFPAVC